MTRRAPGILIAGTSSDAGKSLVVTGLCRLLRRRGIDVAPYKAQNMSNNSMVCADGAEIGRAQYLQALAARVEPTSAMNPVLLKPGTDRRAHVVLRGRPGGTLEAGDYATDRQALREAAWAAYEELAATHELIVAEGAGSPAEINLRRGDYVNLGLARRFDLPVVLVGDIDRGGVLASLYGTWAILDEADRACLRGYVINKFRGDQAILDPGLAAVSERTGLPCLGVLPYLRGVWLDGEDALAIARWRGEGRGAAESAADDPSEGPAATADTLGTADGALGGTTVAPGGGTTGLHDRGAGLLRVAVVRFPRISNATDVDALAHEEGVDVAVTDDPRRVRDADLVVLPGSRSTLDDLAWLRETGLADAVLDRAREGLPVLGICGGYQMLAERIEDEAGIESARSRSAPGLGLLPVVVRFQEAKTLGRPRGEWEGHEVLGYEIRHGRCDRADLGPGSAHDRTPTGDRSSYAQVTPFLEGWSDGIVWGTLWHGALENDGFRRAWLTRIATASGSTWRPRAQRQGYADRREAMIDTLADALAEHVDVDAVLALTRSG